MALSLESFNNERIKPLLHLFSYKHLVKLLLALDELNKASSLSDIENCFVSHRQIARYSSLKKTIKVAKNLNLVRGDREYSLTQIGKQRVEHLKKAISKLEAL